MFERAMCLGIFLLALTTGQGDVLAMKNPSNEIESLKGKFKAVENKRSQFHKTCWLFKKK